jgi:hypothetical protein
MRPARSLNALDVIALIAYRWTVRSVPINVIETPGFLRDAADSLKESERFEMITVLACKPEMGEVMPGTRGARKLRWRSVSFVQ